MKSSKNPANLMKGFPSQAIECYYTSIRARKRVGDTMSMGRNQSDANATHGLTTVADLVEVAGRMAPLAAVLAGGDRVEDLRLVESARDHGIIDRIVLVGQEDRITRAVSEVGIQVDRKDMVPADSDEHTAATAVGLIKAGGIDMVLKGSISSRTLHRHMMPLAHRPTFSLTSVFDAAPISNGRPMVLTDAGVTTVCSFGRMVGMVNNAVDLARVVMEIDRPRVAILSAYEKPIASMASTRMGAELSKRNWPDAVVYGPLSLDLATDPRSVDVKGVPDLPGAREVAGQADVLVCPCIDSANVIYKIVSMLIKYGEASLANFIVGFPLAYVLLSRSDALETRLNSLALGSVFFQRSRERQSPKPRPVAVPRPRSFRVLVINPGSMTLKVSVFENERCVHDAEIARETPAMSTRAERAGQVKQLIHLVRQVLEQSGTKDVDAVAARGGFVPRPPTKLPGGTYLVAELRDSETVVDQALVSAVLDHPEKDHACNLGIPIAAALARHLRAPAYTVDPVVVDEFPPEAEISGYAGIVRRSTSHALSVREAARRAAEAIGRPVEDVNLVVAHLGGGITVAAVRRGKMIDNNIALLGGGPFTPQRAGQLPMEDLIDLCYSGRFTHHELMEELTKRGGLASYLGEHRMEEIETRIKGGDEHARLVVDAMVYQIAKEIGGMFVAAGCDIEAIVLTGGLVRSRLIRDALRRRVGRLAPVMVFEGSLEMAALAAGAIDVLSGREEAHRYRIERLND